MTKLISKLRTAARIFAGSDDLIPSQTLKAQKQQSIRLGPMERNQNHSQLPIIFIHRKNSAYLKYSLSQAKNSNPDSTIYLLGDASNDCYDIVCHDFYGKYFEEGSDFSRIYVDYNTNAFDFELWNFQRWFILKEFIIANVLDKCLYVDSDVMLYADVTEEQKKFEQYDFTLAMRTNGCTFVLNNIDALVRFCEFVHQIYSKIDRYYYDKMVAQFAVIRRNGRKGGASDMVAFDLYQRENFGEIGEVTEIIDGSVFDPAINIAAPGFVMSGGLKRIIWKGGFPFGIHARTGSEIRFNSLHFQSKEGKALMNEYVRG